jgi:hypothetical protein
MIENLVFYNHWQNGDIHVSREFVKFFIDHIPSRNYIYLNHKSPELLKDIPQLRVEEEGLIYLDNDSPFMWNLHTGTLCLNTWYGVSPVFKDTASCTIDTLYHLFNTHLNKIFNTNINPLKLPDFIPSIDYSYFKIEGIKKYLSLNKNPRILICNGAVVSKQSKNFSFNDIVKTIAVNYPSVDFIMTEKFLSQQDNILFTDDIIAKDGNDLNEISYLSKWCDSIIGRSSGPYIYSMVKENLMNPEKTFVCFSDDEAIAWWSDDRNMFKCKTVWSNDYTEQNVANRIIETLREKK